MPKNMQYDQVSSKAGSGKKKGPAESKELSEDGPVIDQADKGSGRKKGGAKHHGNMPPKKGSGDHKEGHKGGAKKDIMMDENMSGGSRKKGSAQMTSAERFAQSDKASDDFSKKVYGGKKGSTNIRGKKMAGFNFMPPENPGNPEDYQKGKSGSRGSVGKPDIASYAYDANQDGDSFFNDRNQDGTMLGRGIQSAIKYFGGSRGYTQNFGPARQNSYAKGAAKVADIMGKGAAKYGGNKGDDSESKKDYEG